MINYIKSEVYKNLHLKSNYIFIINLIVIVLFLNISLFIFSKIHSDFPYATTESAFKVVYSFVPIHISLAAAIVGFVFGEEYINRTLKNSISFGKSRDVIYFSKILISIMYTLIVGILVSSIFIISAYLLLDNSGIEHLKLLIYLLISYIPLILFSITVAHSLYFILEKEKNIIFSWVIIVIVVPQILNSISSDFKIFKIIASYMPFNFLADTNFLETIKGLVIGGASHIILFKYTIVSIAGCIIFYFIGLEVFKRKEIK